jgi:RNase H-fold protein (predicted Holliday junction resolvase)
MIADRAAPLQPLVLPDGRVVRVLAVDPGREKCGLAVLDSEAGLLARGVVPTGVLPEVALEWSREHQPTMVVVGSGTAAGQVEAALRRAGGDHLPLERQPEQYTTERARRRYFAEHPPRGWRRLLPISLMTPPVPVDDYAATLIAEDFLHTLALAAAGTEPTSAAARTVRAR